MLLFKCNVTPHTHTHTHMHTHKMYFYCNCLCGCKYYLISSLACANATSVYYSYQGPYGVALLVSNALM